MAGSGYLSAIPKDHIRDCKYYKDGGDQVTHLVTHKGYGKEKMYYLFEIRDGAYKQICKNPSPLGFTEKVFGKKNEKQE